MHPPNESRFAAQNTAPTHNILRGRDLQGAQHFDTDVVVGGSGASGAVGAATLAAAGQRVMIVEEVPYVRATDVAGMWSSLSVRNGLSDVGMSAAIVVGQSPLVNVTIGRVVGGSSLLTGGLCFGSPGYVL